MDSNFDNKVQMNVQIKVQSPVSIDPCFAHLDLDNIIMNILIDVQQGYDFDDAFLRHTYRFVEPMNYTILRDCIARRFLLLVQKVQMINNKLKG